VDLAGYQGNSHPPLRDCRLPWQMVPVAERPLLRVGDDVVVLDERRLLDRLTRERLLTDGFRAIAKARARPAS
jgi:hypothetical protein